MNRNFKKEIRYNVLLMIVLVLIITAVAVYTQYSVSQSEKYAQYTIEQNTLKISKGLDSCVNSALSSIQLTSVLTSQILTDSTLEKAGEVLDPPVEQTPFNFIEYINRDGMNTTDKGEQFNACDREYFREGIKGNTGIWVNFEPKYSDEILLNFYTPLYYHNEISGVLTGTLGSESVIRPLLDISFFGEKMIGLLTDENGRVISSSTDTYNNTYIENIADSLGVPEEEKKLFSEYAGSEEGRFFEFSCSGGKAMACIIHNEATGWNIIEIVPPSAIRHVMMSNTNSANIVFAFISFMLIGCFIVIRSASIKKHKEILNEKDRVVRSYEQILITTASDTYKGIRQINLETAYSDYIYFENHKLMMTGIGDWNSWLENQRENIHPDDWDRLVNLLRIENLKKMQEGKVYREDYRSVLKNENGYHRVYSTTVSITYIDGRKTAVMTTIDNTVAVVHEMEQKQLLLSVASIYISVHAINLRNDSIEAVCSAPYITEIIGGRENHVQELLRDVMYKLTDEQFREPMMAFIDFKTLDERMKDTNTIILEFLGVKSGWCRARFIAVDYDDNHCLNRVLWVVENIDAEKREANKLLYLSETDLMTGIRNRGSGERKIKELIAADRQGMFCLIDADKFKYINDSFGHGAGDKVLIAIAGCLKESFRDSDVVMRLGGDEFAVFAAGITDRNSAEILIKRFLDRISSISIPDIGDYRISVSLGAAVRLSSDGWDFEDMYRNADSCTYISKKTNGNSYTFYGDSSASCAR